MVWRIDLHDEDNVPPIPFDDLGLLAVESTYSVAFAINDEDPPIIVGESDVFDDCFCTPPLKQLVARGYWVAFTDPPPDLATNGIRLVHDNVPPGCRPVTSTRDVNTPFGPLAPTIAAGISTEDPSPQCVGDPTEAGTVWKDGAPVGVDLASSGPSRWEARGVSDSGAVVGNSISPTSALYWRNSAAAPLPIGDLVDGASIAQRINMIPNVLPLQAVAVGWHAPVFSPLAVLWECPGSCNVLANWNAFELDGEIADCNAGWTLRKAYDVNDAGFIVGWGRRNNENHAFLLEPQDPCCPADLDGDGDVGVKDLLFLLGSWGACPDCGNCGVECVADLNCDCSVGTEDLLILEGAWGPCEGSDGGSSDALEEAIQEMGYDDLEDYHEWLAQASDAEALASGWVLYALLTDGA